MSLINLATSLSALCLFSAEGAVGQTATVTQALWVASSDLSVEDQVLTKKGAARSLNMKLISAGDLEATIRTLAAKVPELDDRKFREQLRRAQRAFVDLKLNRAERAYAKALQEVFNHPLSLPNTNLLARVYFEKSQISRAKRKNRQAERELRLAVSLNPKLRPDPDRYGPPVIRAVQSAKKSVQASTQYNLIVNLAPADAAVWINGIPIKRGDPIRVRGRGPHLLSAERLGYRAYVQLIDLKAEAIRGKAGSRLGSAAEELAIVMKPAEGPVLAQQILRKWLPAGGVSPSGKTELAHDLALQLARVSQIPYVIEALPSADAHVELKLSRSADGEVIRSVRGRRFDWEPFGFAVLTEALAGRTLERPDLKALMLAVSAPSRVNAGEDIEVIVQIRDSAGQLRALQAKCGEEVKKQKIAGIKEGALSLTLDSPTEISSVVCQVTGYNEAGESIVIAPPEDNPLTVLIDDPMANPWYGRWYVWTAIVGAVAAGGAGAAYLGTRGPPPEEHRVVFSLQE